jgi:protein-ribulosamine 3-kinase
MSTLNTNVPIVLPEGTKVELAEPYGNSAWTITGRVSVILPDGIPKRYFLKV